jgi:hypothetical protein
MGFSNMFGMNTNPESLKRRHSNHSTFINPNFSTSFAETLILASPKLVEMDDPRRKQLKRKPESWKNTEKAKSVVENLRANEDHRCFREK